ncbi:hypothetical protein ACFOW1_03940 [Parasediminibacterium paludis]|uniref:Uncharacterized protein n=1 Tax=Parasediminibacterium paludis TaxID=908966 RepID=A0ABV8PSP9_9BACT
MNATKIKLSATELDLVTNAAVLLTKNTITNKVITAFGALANDMQIAIMASHLPENVLASTPKIARGENYLGLPWVMLDYPRVFAKQDVFAIRTFFWWGNCLSVTLQLSGIYQQQFQAQIFALLSTNDNDWLLCCNIEDAWQHHFEANNYKPFSQFSKQEFAKLPFIKLAKKIPLQEWDNIETFIKSTFDALLQLLAT